jgi:hypothetical protein
MALTTNQRLDAAMRLCRAVTGEDYGTDYDRVTGIGVGIAEPGYGDADTVWVLGNWNDITRYNPDGTRTVVDNRYARLGDALERIGVEAHWLDEWQECDGCHSIVRCNADSYMWQPSYATVGDETYCSECAPGDYLQEVLESYIGDYNRCVTSWVTESELTAAGFIRWNEPPFENGWHPGQTDNPRDISERFESENPGSDWVFYLDENSQFYSRFSLFYRPVDSDVSVGA